VAEVVADADERVDPETCDRRSARSTTRRPRAGAAGAVCVSMSCAAAALSERRSDLPAAATRTVEAWREAADYL